MKLEARKASKYCSFTVEDGNTKMDSGLLDAEESCEMAVQLMEAASLLLYHNGHSCISADLDGFTEVVMKENSDDGE